MTAPSPGIISTTMLDAFYGSQDKYLTALSREMKNEYHAIHKAGLILQIDAPDLAMDRIMMYRDLDDAGFVKAVERHVRAINEGIDGIPRDRVRLHVCYGNWEGPHIYDVPLEKILPALYQAQVGALSIEFSNPRHAHEYAAFKKHPLPKDMLLIPGVIETTVEFRRASGSGGAPHRGGRRRGRRARARDRLDRLRLRHLHQPRMGDRAGGVAEARALRQGADIASARLWGARARRRGSFSPAAQPVSGRDAAGEPGARSDRRRVERAEDHQRHRQGHKQPERVAELGGGKPAAAGRDQHAHGRGQHRPAQPSGALRGEIERQPGAEESVERTDHAHIERAVGEHVRRRRRTATARLGKQRGGETDGFGQAAGDRRAGPGNT